MAGRFGFFFLHVYGCVRSLCVLSCSWLFYCPCAQAAVESNPSGCSFDPAKGKYYCVNSCNIGVYCHAVGNPTTIRTLDTFNHPRSSQIEFDTTLCSATFSASGQPASGPCFTSIRFATSPSPSYRVPPSSPDRTTRKRKHGYRSGEL